MTFRIRSQILTWMSRLCPPGSSQLLPARVLTLLRLAHGQTQILAIQMLIVVLLSQPCMPESSSPGEPRLTCMLVRIVMVYQIVMLDTVCRHVMGRITG